MHELSITRSVVSIVLERAAGRKVKGVRLTVGELSGVEVDALRFCFPIVAEGTDLAKARLDIDQVPGRAHCSGCDQEISLQAPLGRCPCERKASLTLLSGKELSVKEMELE